MPLSQEEVDEIKNQLREQVNNLPLEKKDAALKQIDEMSNETIESLVKQQQSRSPQNNKSIFRMIVDKDISAVDVGENNVALAVLDINPVSKGHTMIIPKKEIKDSKNLPAKVFSLAKKIGKNIVSALKAKSTEIQTENKFGESIIHVIPIYDAPLSLQSQRQKSSKEELDKIGDQIRIKKKVRIPKIKIPSAPNNQPDKVIRLKRRIA